MTPGPLPLTIRAGTAFPALSITCEKADGSTFDLTDWTPYAHIKVAPGGVLFYDLAPTVTNGPGGIVTIPEIDDQTTLGLTLGNYHWDLILQDPDGERWGPFLEGVVIIKLNVTEPAFP